MSAAATLFTDVGNGLKYAAEQCTAFVADAFSWVPAGWGSAGQWLGNAQRAGYKTSATPVIGAIAVWGPNKGGAASEGHVARVTAISAATGLPSVEEANWSTPTTSSGVGTIDTRAVSASSAAGIIGYILPPPNAPAPRLPAIVPKGTSVADVNPALGFVTAIPGLSSAVGVGADIAAGVDPITAVFNAVMALPAAFVGAIGTAIGVVLSTIGHAIAGTIGTTAHDLGAVVQNHLIPFAVAGVVTAALFA